jgi:hypothetical protein
MLAFHFRGEILKKLLFLLALLLLPACTGSVAYSTYESEAMGFSFEYPQSWALDANELEVNVATDESLFAANRADFNGGAVANISPLPAEVIGGDIVTGLTQFAGFVAASAETEQVGEVATLMINGHDAAQATVNLAEDTTMIVTMIRGNEQVLLIAAVYDEAQYAEILAHVVESVTFTE